MNATGDSDVASPEGTSRVALATVVGVVGIYVAVVAGEALLSGSPSRPGGAVLLPLLGAYALALGAWCGARGWSDASTVVVSGSYLVGILALMPVAEYVDPVGALADPNLPLLAVLFAMALGLVQAISYVGYLIGGRLAD